MKQLFLLFYCIFTTVSSFAGDNTIRPVFFSKIVIDSSCYQNIIIQDYRRDIGVYMYGAYERKKFIGKIDSLAIDNSSNSFFRALVSSGLSVKHKSGERDLFVNVSEYQVQSTAEPSFLHCQLEFWVVDNQKYYYQGTVDSNITIGRSEMNKEELIKTCNTTFLAIIAQQLIACSRPASLQEGMTFEEMSAYRDSLDNDVKQIEIGSIPKGLYYNIDSFIKKQPFVTDFTPEEYQYKQYYFRLPGRKKEYANHRTVMAFHDGKAAYLKSGNRYQPLEYDNGFLYSKELHKVHLRMRDAWPNYGGSLAGYIKTKTDVSYRTKYHPLTQKFYPSSLLRVE